MRKEIEKAEVAHPAFALTRRLVRRPKKNQCAIDADEKAELER